MLPRALRLRLGRRGNLLHLPGRRLVWSSDQLADCRSSRVGGQDGHEGRCRSLHDRHALSDRHPAHINRFAIHGPMTDPNPASRHSKRDAAIDPGRLRLPLLCCSPDPRGLARIQTSRTLSKRSGDKTNNCRQTYRHTKSSSHSADTSRRPSFYAGTTRVLPACTGHG